MIQTPTDALRLVPCPFCGGEAEIEQFGNTRRSTIYCCQECGCKLETGEEFNHGRAWNRRAASASPLPEGGGQCSGITGELDLRLVEWGYASLDEAITHLGKVLDDQAAFDGLAAPTGAK